ncbi:MAG: hypothetical protein DRH90_25910, partial [Deltaproteobacteria bacterium]
MNSRRDFLKKAGFLSGGVVAGVATPALGQSNSDALDDLVLEVNNNPANWDHRTLRDHRVKWSYEGIPLSIHLHDSDYSIGDDDWSLEMHTDNLTSSNPGGGGNIIGTADNIPDS